MPSPMDGFDWDLGNRAKCSKHGVSVATIESIFEREVHVFLAFTIRERDGQRRLRPISARWMHAKEIRHIEAQIAHPED